MPTEQNTEMRQCASLVVYLSALGLLWLLAPADDWVGRGVGAGLPRLSGALAQLDVDVNLTQARQDALDMFSFGYSSYMEHAYPKDDLRPISCRGRNSQGGIALTLIDSLDTLIVMGKREELRAAVDALGANASFDVDQRVHVFELTIRAVGGLLSAHMLIKQDPTLVPGYDGSLLRLAVDLTDRLLPAFDTPTGVPLSWVNLRKGQVRGDTRITCTACAGTLLLEFGVLSRLTGNVTYESKARQAVETIHGMRSSRGLVGNTLDVDKGSWKRLDAGVGAGVDSYYEYLLKSYLAFGDEAYLTMFAEAYSAAVTQMQLSPAWNGFSWLMDVHMGTGQLLHAYVWSLGAFWPGLQVLAGQVGEAAGLLSNWTAAWNRFGWLPEMFEMSLDHRHPTLTGYPLRPELMESTYLLYTATRDPRLLGLGASLLGRLRDKNAAKCGYASVQDVSTGQLEDTMESFFLSETVKYLYLLLSNATGVVDFFVLSTEGHLFPPFPASATAAAAPDASSGAEGAAAGSSSSSNGGGGKNGTASSGAGGSSESGASGGGSKGVLSRAERKWQQGLSKAVGAKCSWLCAAAEELGGSAAGESGSDGSGNSGGSPEATRGSGSSKGLSSSAVAAAVAEAELDLRGALPLLPLNPRAPAWLLTRRCTACRVVTRAVAAAQRERQAAAAAQAAAQAAAAAAAGKAGAAGVVQQLLIEKLKGGRQRGGKHQGDDPPLSGSGLPLLRQFICTVQVVLPGKLGCGSLSEIAPRLLTQRELAGLSPHAVLVQVTDAPEEELAALEFATVEVSWGNGSASHFQGQLGAFGPGFRLDCGPLAEQLQEEEGEGACGWDPRQEGAGPDAGQHPRNQQQEAPGCRAEAAALANAAAATDGGECSAGTGGRQQQQQHGGAQPPPPPAAAARVPLARINHCTGVVYSLEEEEDEYEDPDGEGSEGIEGSESGSVDPSCFDPAAGAAAASAAAAAAAGMQQQQNKKQQPAAAAAEGAGTAPELPPSVCSAEGRAVAAAPLLACQPLANKAEMKGAVVLLQRGTCSFLDKVLAAEAAGAAGVVVVNGVDELMSMGGDESGRQPHIPSVLVPRSAGTAILEALAAARQQQKGGGGSSSGDRDAAVHQVSIRLYALPEGAAPEQAPPAGGGSESEGGAGAGEQPAAEEAGQCRLDEHLDPQQQQQQQQGGQPGQQGEGAGEGQQAPPPSHRLELLVPPNSQPFILDTVYQKQMDLSMVFSAVMKALGLSDEALAIEGAGASAGGASGSVGSSAAGGSAD